MRFRNHPLPCCGRPSRGTSPAIIKLEAAGIMRPCNAVRQVRCIGRHSQQWCCTSCARRHTLSSHHRPRNSTSQPTLRRNYSGDLPQDIASSESPDARNRPERNAGPLKAFRNRFAPPVKTRERLPIPPLFHDGPTLKEKYTSPDNQNLYDWSHDLDMNRNTANAPFSTAFAQNPYAHALAVPVRACTLTDARLPRSCLLDFHIASANKGEEQADVLQEGNYSESVNLMPLSLAAAMTTKSTPQYRRTPEQIELNEKWEGEAASGVPTGVASYMIGKYSAVEWISKAGKSWQAHACSRRLLKQLKDSPGVTPKWKPDMQDLILGLLRRLVYKKLRYFLEHKDVKDKSGMVCEPPGGQLGLDRINHVDQVSCVLETGIKEARSASQDYTGDLESQAASSDDDVNGASGFWSTSRAELLFEGARPVQGPEKEPSETHFPTTSYRGRKVPVYNLPFLLGREKAQELVKKTVFKESSHVLITAHRGTVDVQLWLLRLHTYVAGKKSDYLAQLSMANIES